MVEKQLSVPDCESSVLCATSFPGTGARLLLGFRLILVACVRPEADDGGFKRIEGENRPRSVLPVPRQGLI